MKPETVGMSSARLRRLDEMMKRVRKGKLDAVLCFRLMQEQDSTGERPKSSPPEKGQKVLLGLRPMVGTRKSDPMLICRAVVQENLGPNQ